MQFVEQCCLVKDLNISDIARMVKRIEKAGDSYGIIFDSDLMQRAGLQPGDKVNVQVDHAGKITLTPLRTRPAQGQLSKLIKQTMKDYSQTMKRLA